MVAEQPRRSLFPLFRAGLALLGAVAVFAAIWIGSREKAPRSFGSVAVLPFRTVSDSGGDYLGMELRRR